MIPLSLDTSTTRTGHQHLPAEKHACGHGECGVRFREIALYLLFCQRSHGEIFKFCFFPHVYIKPQAIIFYKYGVLFSEINVQLNNEINLLSGCYSLLE